MSAEDCGGPPGYADLLKIIANPGHKNYRSMINWLGGKFDPAVFDPAKVNARLKSMR